MMPLRPAGRPMGSYLAEDTEKGPAQSAAADQLV